MISAAENQFDRCRYRTEIRLQREVDATDQHRSEELALTNVQADNASFSPQFWKEPHHGCRKRSRSTATAEGRFRALRNSLGRHRNQRPLDRSGWSGSRFLTMGNGIGLPSVFVIVGLVYVLFSVGFTAMSKYTTNAGAFYAYIAQGLGRPWGISAAFVAILSYNAMQLACYGMLGFFLSTGLHDWIGVDVPWWICCLGALLVILVASVTNIEISGRLLFFLLAAEMLVIAAFDVAAVLHGGPAGYTLAPFTPQHTFTAGFGTAIVFVVGSYMGFETTAIYAEEAKEPHRNIPLATYISITTIMVLYTFSVWALIVVWGPSEVVSMAGKDPAGLWYGMAERIAGKFISEAMQALMLTSLFAALLSFHNTTSRYIFSLGREEVLPKVLSTVSRGQQAPVVACAVQATAVAAALLLFAWSKSDPMNVVLPYTAALDHRSPVGSMLDFAFGDRLFHAGRSWRERVGEANSAGGERNRACVVRLHGSQPP